MPKKTPVIKLAPDGTLLDRYGSMVEAALDNNENVKSLGVSAHKRCALNGVFYIRESEYKPGDRYHLKTVAIEVTKPTGEITTMRTLTDTAKYFGISTSCMFYTIESGRPYRGHLLRRLE